MYLYPRAGTYAMPATLTRWDPFAEIADFRDGDKLVIRADVRGVKPEQIKAKTRDGVLEVTIPLPKEAAKEPLTITPTVE